MRLRKQFSVLLKSAFYSKTEKATIEKAFTFMRVAHMYQLRKSGEPYYVHLIGVAIKLMRLGFPANFVVAGLLHDTREDAKNVSITKISQKFGPYVAFLVDFMSRNELCGYNSYEEKVRVMLEEDPWAIFLRIADISHNMESPQYYRKVSEKIEEAEWFIKLAEFIAIQKGEEVLKWLNHHAFPNGLFGFLKRLEDKIEKAKKLEGA